MPKAQASSSWPTIVKENFCCAFCHAWRAPCATFFLHHRHRCLMKGQVANLKPRPGTSEHYDRVSSRFLREVVIIISRIEIDLLFSEKSQARVFVSARAVHSL